MISTESLFDALGVDHPSTDSDSSDRCKISLPRNPKVVDRVPGGATVTYDWTPDAECGQTWFVSFLRRGKDVVSKSGAFTQHFRGEVYRNLTSNVLYTLDVHISHQGTLSKPMTFNFNSGQSGNIIDKTKMETNEEEQRCNGKVTAPTDGAASGVTPTSATVTYNWSLKQGDCPPTYMSSVLNVKTSSGGSRLLNFFTSSPYHVRGQVYINLRSASDYFTQTFAGSNNTRSKNLMTSFQTESVF